MYTITATSLLFAIEFLATSLQAPILSQKQEKVPKAKQHFENPTKKTNIWKSQQSTIKEHEGNPAAYSKRPAYNISSSVDVESHQTAHRTATSWSKWNSWSDWDKSHLIGVDKVRYFLYFFTNNV